MRNDLIKINRYEGLGKHNPSPSYLFFYGLTNRKMMKKE